MKVRWAYTAFDELSPAELYALLRLRSEVFVVEQNCVFLDMDNSDPLAHHLLGWDATGPARLLAYARCFGPGIKFAEASIGRVITAPAARGTGLGHTLMREAVDALIGQLGASPIRIGAQAHLHGFYEQHGFSRTGEPYMEDGIPHIEMLRLANPGALT